MAVRWYPPGGIDLASSTGISPSRPTPPEQEFRSEVLRGLLSAPKTLPPKLFYDEEGAALFERISRLDEYYLTRAEIEILQAHASEIATLAGPGVALVEYGSGAGIKVRTLLDAMRPRAYVPVDISTEQLARVAGTIASDYPEIGVFPVSADYTAPVRLPPLPAGTRTVGFFPGSTIGNFHPSEAATFLHEVRRTVGPGGALILGVDRRKEARMLEAAYNDAQGVTAAFNLNLLTRINRELGADFRLASFRHRAFFNADASRIEMHLVSLESQTVHVAGMPVHFEPGESIRTEYSYKYDEPSLERLASAGGFSVRAKWTEAGEKFLVAFLEVKRDRFGRMP
ncbi:MAG: L-histidine N(alpha)-methyltransferase [Gemmatimonadetes bacterium]|nr:L-histidine N(alpha)-methyltransferase [Gemmatimonadota bacterium]